jgi:hydrogenase maturation protease
VPTRRSCDQVVIGVGNPLRRDDGLGPAALTRMEGFVPEHTVLVPLDGEAARLVEAWTGKDVAIVVDATRSGAEPGTIRRVVVGEGRTPCGGSPASTHALDLCEAVELARVLGRLPGRLVLYGMEGADFGEGAGLSPEVERRLDDLVDQVLVELTLEDRLAPSGGGGSAEADPAR